MNASCPYEAPPLIRVVIVAQSLIMQTGLEAMMSREPRIQIIGRVADLTTLEQSLRAQQPDVVVLEFALLKEPDFERLIAFQDEVAIVLLVPPTSSYAVTTLLQAGIRAMLPMDITPDEMVLTIEAIAAGLVILHPDVLETLVQELPEAGEPKALSDASGTPLTPREIEVLQLLATGLGNKAIARQLDISEHTVKFHISSIFSKLNAASRTEAVTLGMRQGLIFI